MSEPKRTATSSLGEILVIELLDSQITEYEQSQELRQEIVSAIETSDSSQVIIDMKNVTYLTSVALFIFVDARAATEARDGRTVICNLAEVPLKVLTVTQLLVERRSSANYLQMAEDIDSAVTLLQS